MFDLTEGLIRRKYSDADIEAVLGGNFKRVLSQIWTVTARVTIDAGMIAAARAAIAPYLERTPVVRVDAAGALARPIYVKNETVLPTGSFKVRGAIHALKAACARGTVTEVVAASTGNHGAAVAYAGTLLGVPARIFLPQHSNPVKAGRIRELGAVLVETGRDLTDAIDAAEEYAMSAGAFFLHDASSPRFPPAPQRSAQRSSRTCRTLTRCTSRWATPRSSAASHLPCVSLHAAFASSVSWRKPRRRTTCPGRAGR